ncbi:hypothetical protein M378DRAFT_162661 [Amanita muscaria Koide BX008]|uniref:Uncharacterized protein n=1 Tax=Amanita muscaria (strain Koide BX008) TaxID=946122 RepID=A0A0C2WSX1_AMAMK|nr:hypothetical protein M378DRAFT_162661 [Amanita muscaria Koide BX008]
MTLCSIYYSLILETIIKIDDLLIVDIAAAAAIRQINVLRFPFLVKHQAVQSGPFIWPRTTPDGPNPGACVGSGHII